MSSMESTSLLPTRKRDDAILSADHFRRFFFNAHYWQETPMETEV